MKKALGSRIEHYRDKAGISQRQLAARLEIDKGTIWRWEKGHSWPDYSQLQALAGALGIKSEQLFDEIGKNEFSATDLVSALATLQDPEILGAFLLWLEVTYPDRIPAGLRKKLQNTN